jgi:hypothetical protein
MKLKQTLVLGLTTSLLAIPAFAADEAINATSQPSAITSEQKLLKPAKKEAFHKKGPKNCLTNDSLEAKKMEKQNLSDKLGKVNPESTATKN